MDRLSYLQAVEAAWDRHRPRIWTWYLLPDSIGALPIARRIASGLEAVIDELKELQPPTEDADEIRDRYLTSLQRASSVFTERVAMEPPKSKLAEWLDETDTQMELFADDDDHAFVVQYGLRQWWLPKTSAWDPRYPDGEQPSDSTKNSGPPDHD